MSLEKPAGYFTLNGGKVFVWEPAYVGIYRTTCNACGHKDAAVIPQGVDLTTLACKSCGACDSTTQEAQRD
jgi:hypothetical protein